MHRVLAALVVCGAVALTPASAQAAVTDGGCTDGGTTVTLTFAGDVDETIAVQARPGAGPVAGQVTYGATTVPCADLRQLTIVGDGAANVVALEGQVGGPPLDVLFRPGAGDDTLDVTGVVTSVSMAETAGPNGNDTLIVDAAVEDISADLGEGDDRLQTTAQVGRFDGGAGPDPVSFAGSLVPIVAGFSAPGTGSAGAFTFEGVEALEGGEAADQLTGSDAGERIDGRGGDDVITGGGGDDVLIGGDGDDDLDGGTGDDTLDGGSGDDRLAGGEGADALAGGDDDDLLIGGAGADALDGGPGVDIASYEERDGVLLTVGTGATGEGDTAVGIEIWRGSPGDDVLTGSAGDDRLQGIGGDDLLQGLGGDDMLDGGAGTDTVSYAERIAGQGVTATLAAPTPGGGGVGETDVYVAVENLVGGQGDDALTGDDGPNALDGGEGDDTLTGAGANDTLDGGQGNDNLTGGEGDDVLDGGDGNDTLTGGPGDDTLDGGEGTDALAPGTGAGSVDGGPGTDTLTLADVPVGGTVDLAAGTATIPSGAAAGQTVTGVENLQGGPGPDVLSGDDQANRIAGGAGADSLQGGGDDDILLGEGDNDVLDGGLGTDVLDGGPGTDTITYESRTTPVTITLDGVANDGAPGENDLFVGIEIHRGGGGDDLLDGNAMNNRLEGAGGDDTLRGRGGADTLVGGPGSDLATYDERGAGNPVTVVLPNGGGEPGEGDVFMGIEEVTGGAGDDVLSAGTVTVDSVLTGGPGDDVLTGGRGDDVVAGGLGDDTIFGGEGTDALDGGPGRDILTYADEPASRAVVVDLAAGTGGPPADGAETVSGFEEVIGSPGDDTITGDDLPNVLDGGDGDDMIAGAGGDDLLLGGDEDDVLRGGAGDDVLDGGDDDDELHGGEGDDLLQGGDDNDVLRGDAGDDVLDGGEDDDLLIGGEGADVLAGGLGRDTVSYAGRTEPVAVSLNGAADDGAAGEGDLVVSVEDIVGGNGNDRLVGNQDVNRLAGGPGDDVLIGGLGNDELDGGPGTDLVSYEDRDAGSPVTVNLGATPAGGGPGEADVLTGVEALRGGADPDALTGGPGPDTLDGGPGADRLSGGDGDDRLIGGPGDDVLVGGAGGDALDGGPGNDLLDGGEGIDAFAAGDGDDVILAADGQAEAVGCGAGQDTVTHDAADVLTDCEATRIPGADELPPPPPPVPPLPPRDRDGDGFPFEQDCNDLNPLIRPGAVDIPGNGIDENCDGVDAPLPVVASEIATSFRRVRAGLRVRRAVVSDVPADTTITVTCRTTRRPACPFRERERKLTAPRETYSLRGVFGDRTLSTRARIEIRVTAPGFRGRLTELRMTQRGSPQRTRLCLPVGSTEGVRC